SIGDGMIRTCEPCLVDAHLPEQIHAARADVTYFEHSTPPELVLRAEVELLHVRRPDVAIENGPGERDAGNQSRELVLRRGREERICKWSADVDAEDIRGRHQERERCVLERRSRIEDAVAAADRQ